MDEYKFDHVYYTYSIKVQIRTRAINGCSVDKYASVKKICWPYFAYNTCISIRIIATFTEVFKGDNYL